jgi:hypothetical protein
MCAKGLWGRRCPALPCWAVQCHAGGCAGVLAAEPAPRAGGAGEHRERRREEAGRPAGRAGSPATGAGALPGATIAPVAVWAPWRMGAAGGFEKGRSLMRCNELDMWISQLVVCIAMGILQRLHTIAAMPQVSYCAVHRHVQSRVVQRRGSNGRPSMLVRVNGMMPRHTTLDARLCARAPDAS